MLLVLFQLRSSHLPRCNKRAPISAQNLLSPSSKKNASNGQHSSKLFDLLNMEYTILPTSRGNTQRSILTYLNPRVVLNYMLRESLIDQL